MTRDSLLLSLLASHAAQHGAEVPYDVEDLLAKRRKERALGNLSDAHESLAKAQARLGGDLALALALIGK
jgi:hypothetical protein